MIAYKTVPLDVTQADIDRARKGKETNPIALAARRHFGFEVAAEPFAVRRILDRSWDGGIWGETVAILPIEVGQWLWDWERGKPVAPKVFEMEVKDA